MRTSRCLSRIAYTLVQTSKTSDGGWLPDRYADIHPSSGSLRVFVPLPHPKQRLPHPAVKWGTCGGWLGQWKAAVPALRKSAASFLYRAIDTVRQFLYKIPCTGNFQSISDFFVRSILFYISHIFRNRTGKHGISLRYIGYQLSGGSIEGHIFLPRAKLRSAFL